MHTRIAQTNITVLKTEPFLSTFLPSLPLPRVKSGSQVDDTVESHQRPLITQEPLGFQSIT